MLRAAASPEAFASMLATWKIGAIWVPSHTLLGQREVEHIINNSDSVLALADMERVEAIEAVKNKCPTLRNIIVFGKAKGDQVSFEDFIKDASDELECADTRSDDEAYILYSSGTTGLPKGVVRCHRDIYVAGAHHSRILALTADDIYLNPHDMGFSYFFGTLAGATFAGAQLVLYSGLPNAEGILEYIQKYKMTKFASVPTLYRMILGIRDFEKKYDLSSLMCLLSSGEPLPADTYYALKEHLGIECYDAMAQTECFIICSQRPSFPVKAGSMGKPYPGVTIAILDDDGTPCSPNKVGHLVMRNDSPSLFVEYRKMPEKWEEVHKAFPGWYDTDDLAYYDEEGYFFHAGRADDIIKSRGYLIGPKEVEETILEIPEILNVGVVGAPDPVMASRIKAFVMLKSGHEPSQELAARIREHVKGRIAPYKVPKDIEFVDQLPKTVTGKVKRKQLRQLEEERYNRREITGFRF